MSKTSWRLMFGYIFLFFCAGKQADAAQDLSVCMIEFKPWAFFQVRPDGSREIVGVMPEIVAEFEKRSRTQTTKRVLPYARVELELEHGSCDVALLAWADRRGVFASKGPVLMPLEFGVIAANSKPLKKYEDLRALSISVARGLSISPKFDEDTSLRKELVKDNLAGIRQVEKNHVDAVAGSLLTLRYLIREEGLANRFGDSLVLTSNDFAPAFSKKSSWFGYRAEIDKVFAAIEADGTIREIISRWYR